jgi:hypothetical protein
MKTKGVFYFLLGLSIFLASCEDKSSDIEYKEPKIKSFGFYAEDNVGIIAKDYVIDSVQSTSIIIDLPEGTNKSALIARYTTNENDSVKVNDIKQISGISKNDFSVPIDYILTQGNKNARYTVTIGKAPAYVWTRINDFTTDTFVSAIMKVNSLTGVPYIMYKKSRSASADQKAAMIKLENNTWVQLGEASDGQIGSYYDFAFSSTGEPYISYADYTATIAQMNSVKKFDGTNWSLVGSKGITTSKIYFNAIAFAPNNQLMLFSTIDATGGVLAKRELCISSYDGAAWTTNKTLTGRTSDQVTYLPVAKRLKDTLYLAIYNAVTPNSFSVYKFANNTWTTIVDKWKDANATGINLYDFDMDVDAFGNVFIALVDNSTDGATQKHRVVKYSAKTQTLSSVGNPITGASGSSVNFDLAVSPTGVPYLLYKNESGYPTIVYLDSDSQDWSTPKTLVTESANYLSLDFTSNGEAYACYIINRRPTVYKYSEPK